MDKVDSSLGLDAFPPLNASIGVNSSQKETPKPVSNGVAMNLNSEAATDTGVSHGVSSENLRGDKWRSFFLEDKGFNEDYSKLPILKPQITNGKEIFISSADIEDELKVCQKFLVRFFCWS